LPSLCDAGAIAWPKPQRYRCFQLPFDVIFGIE
jgi:hypothetical protein